MMNVDDFADGDRVSRSLAIAAGTAFVIAGGALASDLLPKSPAPLLSTVTVSLETGKGSGVHIGNGLILSAAHVASEGDTVTIVTSDGKKRDATVVWASLASDIALLSTNGDNLSASPLSCAPVQVGSAVTAHGSPMWVGQLTTHGTIVGTPRAAERWASVVPMDITVLPGMSGGPVVNSSGEVVGITVGVLAYPTLVGETFTGIGFAVPAVVVCALLGRV